MPIFKRKNESFFKIWSPEMAYVLGYLAADGCVFKNKRGAHFMEFTSTDFELITKVKKLLGSDHKIGIYKGKDKSLKIRYRLQIGSRSYFNDVKKFGIVQNKSLIIKFPKVPKIFLGNFIRGYFDGDGCVHLGKYWRKDRSKWRWQFSTIFTSGSKEFLEGLWSSIKPFISGGRLGKKKGGYELVFSQKDSLALFNLMYDNVSADGFLERKHKLFLKSFKVLKMRA